MILLDLKRTSNFLKGNLMLMSSLRGLRQGRLLNVLDTSLKNVQGSGEEIEKRFIESQSFPLKLHVGRKVGFHI